MVAMADRSPGRLHALFDSKNYAEAATLILQIAATDGPTYLERMVCPLSSQDLLGLINELKQKEIHKTSLRWAVR